METGPGRSHDVVIDPGSREAIGRLFRGDRFRFEFGMRRGDDRWFAPTPTEHPALDERRRGPPGSHSGELVLGVLHRLVHLLHRLEQGLVNHGRQRIQTGADERP